MAIKLKIDRLRGSRREVFSRLGVCIACLFMLVTPFLAGCGGEAATPPDYEMMAWEFVDEFMQNPDGFEEKYKDKRISIIGWILVIGEVDEVPILDIGSESDDVYSIYAFFESEASKLISLAKGDFVRVVGTYTGQGFFNLQLHDCSLVD